MPFTRRFMRYCIHFPLQGCPHRRQLIWLQQHLEPCTHALRAFVSGNASLKLLMLRQGETIGGSGEHSSLHIGPAVCV